MFVKLLKEFRVLDKDGVDVGLRTTVKKNKRYKESIIPDGKGGFKVVTNGEKEKFEIPWSPGTVMECSEASAKKMIKSGAAEEVKS